MSTTSEGTLAFRCRAYLKDGPPAHMPNYVPGSLTEIIIAHGANGREIDSGLRELGSIVLLESQNFDRYEDAAIREYMKRGAGLVAEILESGSGQIVQRNEGQLKERGMKRNSWWRRLFGHH